MRFWFSTLPLHGALISELSAAGLEPWPNDQGSPHGDICLLLYDSPERHIAAATEAEVVLSSAALAEGYSKLLDCRETSGQPLLAGWRLERVGCMGIQQWMTGNGTSGFVGDAEPITPLMASVILSLLETKPQLLESYNDLELQAELLGSEADLTYRQRLHQAIGQADPLQQLLATLHTLMGELQEARDENEHTRLELHKAEEKQKQITIDNDRKQQLLDTRTDELKDLQMDIHALQQELQPKVNNLEQQLKSREKQLHESRDDAELTLLKLHQVQDELAQLVLADHQNQQLLETRTQELQSLKGIIQALQQELLPKVEDLEQQLQNRNCELKDAREDAAHNLLQLHQVQEELEQLFLADQKNQQLLGTRNQELQNLKANIQVLQQELQPKMGNLEQQLQDRDRELKDAREEVELTQLQLHQVQAELKHLLLVDDQKQHLLDTRTKELQSLEENIQALQQELQPKLDNLEQQLENRNRELKDARSNAELNLLQLHQVQEELERYFLQTRAGSQLVEAQTQQLSRAKLLMAKLEMNDFSPHCNMAAVAVEVLSGAEVTRQQPSLQVQALLNTYAGSLERASKLLTRAMRH
jgi:chromosome segregation ATPase